MVKPANPCPGAGALKILKVKDIIMYPIINPANTQICERVCFHEVLNTSEILKIGFIANRVFIKTVNLYYIIE